MNSNQLFELSFGVGSPWLIADIKLDKGVSAVKGQLDIYMDFKAGSKVADEAGKACGAYDTESRSWPKEEREDS